MWYFRFVETRIKNKYYWIRQMLVKVQKQFSTNVFEWNQRANCDQRDHILFLFYSILLFFSLFHRLLVLLPARPPVHLQTWLDVKAKRKRKKNPQHNAKENWLLSTCITRSFFSLSLVISCVFFPFKHELIRYGSRFLSAITDAVVVNVVVKKKRSARDLHSSMKKKNESRE